MADWPQRRLGDLCDVVGRGIAPKYDDNGEVIVINQRCIRDGRVDLAQARRHGGRAVPEAKRLLEGDLMVNSTGVGTLGRTAAYVQRDSTCVTVDSHVTILRPRNCEPGFLRLLLRHLEPRIEDLAEGSTGQTELNRHRLADLEVVAPPLDEQRAIAGVLGALDDKIESNRRIIGTVRQLLAGEFHRQLDTASGRTTLRQLNPRLNGVVQTGPFGSNLHASDYEDAGVPLILVKHVTNGSIANRGLPLVGVDKATELGAYRLATNDIVITRVGRVGDAALVRSSQMGWLFSGQMLRVNLAGTPQVDPYWLVEWYQTDEFRALISAYSVGSTRESLSTSILADTPMPIVATHVQASFRAVAEPLHERWATATNESESLAALRDALLPELLSGRLRVPDAEEMVASA